MKLINYLNEILAKNITLAFGTMWTTYAFMVYGFGPLIWPQHMDKMLYWSNTVQLWSLPLLMVGTNILGRNAEKRDAETHDAVMNELSEIKNMHLEMKCKICDGQPGKGFSNVKSTG
jgi:hypothetical protein